MAEKGLAMKIRSKIIRKFTIEVNGDEFAALRTAIYRGINSEQTDGPDAAIAREFLEALNHAEEWDSLVK